MFWGISCPPVHKYNDLKCTYIKHSTNTQSSPSFVLAHWLVLQLAALLFWFGFTALITPTPDRCFEHSFFFLCLHQGILKTNGQISKNFVVQIHEPQGIHRNLLSSFTIRPVSICLSICSINIEVCYCAINVISQLKSEQTGSQIFLTQAEPCVRLTFRLLCIFMQVPKSLKFEQIFLSFVTIII